MVDKGGRVVLFERNETVRPHMSVHRCTITDCFVEEDMRV
jgi:hypothetical protein